MSTITASEQLAMSRKREQLRQLPRARQEATVKFILSCERVAKDMQAILLACDEFGTTPEAAEALAMMEASVRRLYRELLGEEMTGT